MRWRSLYRNFRAPQRDGARNVGQDEHPTGGEGHHLLGRLTRDWASLWGGDGFATHPQSVRLEWATEILSDR